MAIGDWRLRMAEWKRRADGWASAPFDYPITRLRDYQITQLAHQLNRVTSWMTRLEFSCSAVMR